MDLLMSWRIALTSGSESGHIDTLSLRVSTQKTFLAGARARRYSAFCKCRICWEPSFQSQRMRSRVDSATGRADIYGARRGCGHLMVCAGSVQRGGRSIRSASALAVRLPAPNEWYWKQTIAMGKCGGFSRWDRGNLWSMDSCLIRFAAGRLPSSTS
jgi:hypothetical protein